MTSAPGLILRSKCCLLSRDIFYCFTSPPRLKKASLIEFRFFWLGACAHFRVQTFDAQVGAYIYKPWHLHWYIIQSLKQLSPYLENWRPAILPPPIDKVYRVWMVGPKARISNRRQINNCFNYRTKEDTYFFSTLIHSHLPILIPMMVTRSTSQGALR